MSNQEGKVNKLQQFWQNSQPAREKTGRVLGKIGSVLQQIGKWIYRLRSLLLAIPVGIAAVMMAMQNMSRLPGMVGLNLLATGEYQMMVSRSVAVMGPLAVTALCLLLMFCSRRVIYPWLISIFTLVIPVLIYITNIFPA